MSASVFPINAGASQPPAGPDLPQWLDAMGAGTCTQDEFLHQVQRLTVDDPDVPFEVLSLLDQYFRRERITRDVYTTLKTRLQQRSFGFGTDSVPILKPDARLAAQLPPDLLPPDVPLPAGPAVRVAPLVSPDPAAEEPLRAGDILRGRYRVMHILQRDAAGKLVEAIDELRVDVPGVNQRIAIQVMDEPGQSEPELLQRMCALQALSHPGIVRVFEVDEDHGALFMTMEWLTGVSLQQLIEQNGGAKLAPHSAQAIIRTLASALAYAHSRDVFHGEVSAANVFITDSGEVKLRNFEMRGKGLAANPKADRLAFAWLAHGLLAGMNTTLHSRPPGLTSEQWQVLRDALTGKEGRRSGNVLTVFAGDTNLTVGRVPLLQAFAPLSGNRMGVSSWVASGIVATLLGVAIYLLMTHNTALVPPAQTPQVAAAPVQQSAALPQVGQGAAATTPGAAAPEAVPVPVPVYVRARLDLPAESISVDGSQPFARIWVRRRGGLAGEVSFLWWTENGTAEIDRDYAEISPRREYIPAGANGVGLLVPLVSDASRNEQRTFYVKIDDAGPGARLGERTLMQVVIEPAGFRPF